MDSTTISMKYKQASSVPYTLFLYREELNRRNVRILKRSKVKIHLIDGLISRTVHNIAGCTVEDLRDLSRGVDLKLKLKKQIQRIRKLQQLGIKNPEEKMLSNNMV